MSSWTFGSGGKSIVYFFRNIFFYFLNTEFYDYLVKIKIIGKTLYFIHLLNTGKTRYEDCKSAFRGFHVVIFYEL